MRKIVIPTSPNDPVSIQQSLFQNQLELRIGGEVQGEGIYARLTISQAKQIGYVLLLEAEKLDDQRRKNQKKAASIALANTSAG